MSDIVFKVTCTQSFTLIEPTMISLRSRIATSWGAIESNFWYLNAQGDRIEVENDQDLQAAMESEADTLNGCVSLRVDMDKADAIAHLQCQITLLREENASNREQAQEKFDAATGVLSHKIQTLEQKLASTQSALEKAMIATADPAQPQDDENGELLGEMPPHDVRASVPVAAALAPGALSGAPVFWKQYDPSMRKFGAGIIFIKNIDASVTSRDLLDTFSQFGNILSCKVATSEDGKSKGFGFVKYLTREEAERAVKSTNGQKLTPAQSVALAVVHYFPPVYNPKKAFTNVFVKNLRDDVTDEQLNAAFASFGSITSCVVQKDKASGKSLRFGFCNFATPEAAKLCVDQIGDTEGLAEAGERIKVVPHLKANAHVSLSQSTRSGAGKEKPFQYTNLYVKYLDDDITDDKLRAMFAACGQITSAKVEMDREKGVAKNFGYVNFSTAEEATKAVTEMNGKTIGSKPLYVCLHMTVQQRRDALSQSMRQPNYRAPMYPGMMPYMYPGMPMGPYGRHFLPRGGMGMMRPVGPRMMPGQGPAGPWNAPFMGPGQMAVRPPRANPAGGPAMGQAPARPAGPGQPQAVFKQQARNVPSAAPGASAAAAPAQNKNDLAAMLAAASPEQQKPLLGERLYMLIIPTQPQLAGKITGMLLEALDTAELLGLIDSPLALDEKIKLALEALQKHSKT